ncbi:MAG: primase [Solirubrobacteraceae bacterium]|nr:primase [Solirubrobacteraceae bacterium]
MARYTDDSRERVRDAVDMVDLVGTRVELRRAGVNRFEGLCPFHDERTPSFGINPAEKVFYCFGCSEGGDAFKFVQLTEGVDFKGSLELLADRYGVTLEVVEEDAASAERRRSRERLLELLERTAAFYVRYLWDSTEAAGAREYLAGRGLEEGALREFRVGYAPSAWDKVLIASRRAGFSDRELVESGLATRAKGEGRTYDRFRRRIMFPLCDTRGRVLGFGARAMGADQKPKYVNSSDNAVYHKGRHLFGADIARAPAAKLGVAIVAEGYTDVIAMHQAGLRHTVGLMGTALTEEQVGELARLAPTVLLALDADAAGQEAMLRGAHVAARRNLSLRVVALPPGSDPADLVRDEGARAMAARVDASVPFERFQVEQALGAADLESAEGKDTVIAALRPVFALIPPSAMREELVGLVADRTALAPALAASWLAQGASGPGSVPGAGAREQPENGAPRRPAAPPAALDAAGRAERSFLAQCLAAPAIGLEALRAMDFDAVFTSDLTRRAAAHLRARLSGAGAELPADDDELAALVAELVVRSGQMSASESAMEGERLRLDLFALEREIAAARTAGTTYHELVVRRQDLRRRVNEAQGRSLEETQARE